ncbi:nucleolar protein 16 isoform 4 [Homo sapiens]|uniref:nucleolar protein 16 isoform 4 n=1 Tax=Homo sapiens TaxID=9606 RepID=UPI00043B9039|nr:nucleolar protein 16 isoform 4 [Homo sapiens]|eukprot:NP_001278234.1 nucleolar protein 16 isoform 4 [Homo sapiens]
MLDGRQRRGSNAPTSDMPGTTLNRYGRTWPRWGWLWTPTGRCPSVRERSFWSQGLCSLQVKAMEVDIEERPKELVRKPYVLNDLEAEASLPEKKGNTLSRDLIDYVRYMVENHGEDYKSGKTSSILCRRGRWRWSDWFTSQLPQAEASPGPVKLEPGCKARRCCVAPEELARSHGIRRLHTHVHTPRSGEGTVLRGSNLYSSGGSRKSQNLLFSGWVM